MTLDIEKLKALALAATKGTRRWWACRDGDHDYAQIAARPEHIAQVRIRSVTEADLQLMVASDPDTILALIAEVERLRAALAGAEKDAERWQAFRARDEFDDLDFTAFQDQFREDADEIIDAAIKAKEPPCGT